MLINFQYNVNGNRTFHKDLYVFFNKDKKYVYDSYYFANDIALNNGDDEFYGVYLYIKDYLEKAKAISIALPINYYLLLPIGLYDEYTAAFKIVNSGKDVYRTSLVEILGYLPVDYSIESLKAKELSEYSFQSEEVVFFEMSLADILNSFSIEYSGLN